MQIAQKHSARPNSYVSFTVSKHPYGLTYVGVRKVSDPELSVDVILKGNDTRAITDTLTQADVRFNVENGTIRLIYPDTLSNALEALGFNQKQQRPILKAAEAVISETDKMAFRRMDRDLSIMDKYSRDGRRLVPKSNGQRGR